MAWSGCPEDIAACPFDAGGDKSVKFMGFLPQNPGVKLAGTAFQRVGFRV
jgi:hypothetical protein